MWQVNLKHPEEETAVGIFISDAVDEQEAKAKALKFFAGPNPELNLGEGYVPTLVRQIKTALISDATDVMFSNA